jgi:transcriptional regulator with XRE-family HTH domain
MANTPTAHQLALAAKLREVREDLGLTQAQIATELSREKTVQGPTISTWESSRNPVRPPSRRIEAYARVAATRKRGGPVLVPLAELSDGERETYAEMLSSLTDLYDAADPTAGAGESLRPPALWDFPDEGPLAIICPTAPDEVRGPLANPEDPNYTESHAFADVDALIDLYGHIRMEVAGRFTVSYSSAEGYRIEDLSGHLVLLGGSGWNDLTRLLESSLTRLPVRQIDNVIPTGEVFEIGEGDRVQRFTPEWQEGSGQKILHRDIGYIARTRNPYNPRRTLTICNGVHSRGVLGAVRTLTDVRFRRDNEAYIAEHFPDGEFAILIKVPVVQGKAIGVSLADPEAVLYRWPEDVR